MRRISARGRSISRWGGITDQKLGEIFQRFVWEVVRLRRFDLASVGSFDKFLVNSSPQEMMKAFFEGSAILVSQKPVEGLEVNKANYWTTKNSHQEEVLIPKSAANPLPVFGVISPINWKDREMKAWDNCCERGCSQKRGIISGKTAWNPVTVCRKSW